MTEHIKYPRTPHLPWSEGLRDSDRMIRTIMYLMGVPELVVSEKLDGENITIYNDGLHARSLDGGGHPSRNWLKNWHGGMAHTIPDGMRICGEYMWQPHSIRYYDPSLKNNWFRVFSVWEGDTCLDWESTVIIADMLELPTVPVLYTGEWNNDTIKACWTSKSQLVGDQEGYVVRSAGDFKMDDFDKLVAKYVRKNHVQDYTPHWAKGYNIPPNGSSHEEVEFFLNKRG